MKKIVPLVLYVGDERREIGVAEVDLETGEVAATISEATRPGIEDVASIIIKGTLGRPTGFMSFSLGEDTD